MLSSNQAWEPLPLSPRALEPVLCNKGSHHGEQPMQHNEGQPLLTADPHSQNKEETFSTRSRNSAAETASCPPEIYASLHKWGQKAADKRRLYLLPPHPTRHPYI